MSPWYHFNGDFNPNPILYCPHCNRIPLISPIEREQKLCYVCMHWRDYYLKQWKRGEELAISDMEDLSRT